MLQILKSVDGKFVEADVTEVNIWIHMVKPTAEEINRVAEQAGFHPEFLHAALDAEERARIESEAGQLLIVIDIPVENNDSGDVSYDTIPLGIVVTRDRIATVCLQDTPILRAMEDRRVRQVSTAKRTRFVLQILYRTATQYLAYLRRIDRRIDRTEQALRRSLQNKHLFHLMSLQKSLVYFTTSLKANQIVLEKLLRSQMHRPDRTLGNAGPTGDAGISGESWIAGDDGSRAEPEVPETAHVLRMYPEDGDLLEDVITENKQAIEMGDVYTHILVGLMDAFASIVSNNLNMVMKFLAIVTIVLAIPTSVFSFYGMNVALPMQNRTWAWAIALALSVVLGLVGIVWLRFATSRSPRER